MGRALKKALLLHRERYAAVFFVALFALVMVAVVTAYAATTIGTNISTTGTASTTSATTTAYLSVGVSVTTPLGFDYLNDLMVSDDAFINSELVVGGTATTCKLIVGERVSANATTTVVFGDLVSESTACIKLRTTSGAWIYAYATSTSSMIAEGLVWTTDSCE